MKELAIIAFLSAFIMIWRSEGLFIGAGGFLFALMFVWENNIKKITVTVLVLLCSFLCFHKIQGIGSEKYYGQDYMFINTMRPLYSILNNPQADLSYTGAEEDIAALEAVLPVDIIKQSGLTGYRNYNYTLGHADFNQTLADDEKADNYMKAYYRIIFHNIGDYIDAQINLLYASLQINCTHTTYSYSGEEFVELDNFVYDKWRHGSDEVRATFLTSQLEESEIHRFLNNVASRLMAIWRELWTATGLNVLLHAGAVIANICILCLELIFAFLEKDKRHLGWGILFMTVFTEMLAVALFMPEGRAAYLYPVLYTDYLLIYFYIVSFSGGRRENREVCR